MRLRGSKLVVTPVGHQRIYFASSSLSGLHIYKPVSPPAASMRGEYGVQRNSIAVELPSSISTVACILFVRRGLCIL